jgi:hypothetical protein
MTQYEFWEGTEERKKREGMEQAAKNNSRLLALARAHARRIALANGGISDAEMVREAMIEAGEFPPPPYSPTQLNWMGSIHLYEEGWRKISKMNCSHEGGHKREINRWMLVNP